MLTLEAAPRANQPLGGESTLDDLIVSAWEGLTSRQVVACPLCASPMSPRYGELAHPPQGRCEGCASTLS